MQHWGIKGATTRAKKIELIRNDLEKPQELLFLIIQETHWTDENDIPSEISNHNNMFEIRNSFAHREDSWSGITAIINKTHSVEEFNEIIKGRLLHIKIAHKFSKEITNILTYYGYQQSQEEDEKLILHISKVEKKSMMKNYKT